MFNETKYSIPLHHLPAAWIQSMGKATATSATLIAMNSNGWGHPLELDRLDSLL